MKRKPSVQMPGGGARYLRWALVFIIAGFVLSNAIAIYEMRKTQADVQRLALRSFNSVDLVSSLARNLSRKRILVQNHILETEESGRAGIEAEIAAGRVPVAAIDEAVRRVLRVKFNLGLFANDRDPDKLPPGIDDGMVIRLQGEGEGGGPGGVPGDLHCLVRVRPHKLFAREGLELHCEVPITISQAALGGSLEVPTLDGKYINVNLARGTQTGDEVRIRLDGKTVLDTFGKRGEDPAVTLILPDRPTPFVVEFSSVNFNDRGLKLNWVGPGKDDGELVPREVFFHDRKAESALGK